MQNEYQIYALLKADSITKIQIKSSPSSTNTIAFFKNLSISHWQPDRCPQGLQLLSVGISLSKSIFNNPGSLWAMKMFLETNRPNIVLHVVLHTHQYLEEFVLFTTYSH